MAELSSKALANFTAATSSLILTESLRLVRNYRYYNDIAEDSVTRFELIQKVRNARKFAFTLENLMSKNIPEEAPFYVAISGNIYDLLEEIHRKILFYDADLIADIIPQIDNLRSFWSEFSETDFYDTALLNKLEHSIPKTLISIEDNLMDLPPFARI